MKTVISNICNMIKVKWYFLRFRFSKESWALRKIGKIHGVGHVLWKIAAATIIAAELEKKLEIKYSKK